VKIRTSLATRHAPNSRTDRDQLRWLDDALLALYCTRPTLQRTPARTMKPQAYHGLLALTNRGMTSATVDAAPALFSPGTRIGHTGDAESPGHGVCTVRGVQHRVCEFIQTWPRPRGDLLLGTRSDTDDADGR